MSKYRVLLTRVAGVAVPVSSIALNQDLISQHVPSSTSDEVSPTPSEVAPDISKTLRALSLSQPKALVLPRASMPSHLDSTYDQVVYQRIARLGGSLLYPLMSLMTTNVPFAMGLIGYMPFCVVLHHLSVKKAIESVSDLIKQDKLLPNESDNVDLKAWIKAEGIDSVSFNTQGDLVLFKQEELSLLADRLTLLDRAKLNGKADELTFVPWSRDEVPYLFRSETINFFHLNKEVQQQVSRVMRERSKRFRGPLIFGAAGYSLSFLSPIFVGFRGRALLSGMLLGAYSTKTEVGQETMALKELIAEKHSLEEIVADGYLDEYPTLKEKKEVALVVNIFGDIVIDPALTSRQAMLVSFEDAKTEQDQVTPRLS